MASLGAVGIALLATGTVCLTSGCSTVGYYAHSVIGHLAIVRAAKPVPEWLPIRAPTPVCARGSN